TLEDAKPLLNLVHPGTVNRHKETDEAGMRLEPCLNLFPFMDTGIIKHEKDALHPGWGLSVKFGKQGDEFFLAFAQGGESRDFARARVKGSEQMECSGSFVLVLQARWQARSGRQGGNYARTRLQIRLLIDAQHQLPVSERAGVQLNDFLNLFGKPLIARDFGRQPEVMSPRLEFM